MRPFLLIFLAAALSSCHQRASMGSSNPGSGAGELADRLAAGDRRLCSDPRVQEAAVRSALGEASADSREADGQYLKFDEVSATAVNMKIGEVYCLGVLTDPSNSGSSTTIPFTLRPSLKSAGSIVVDPNASPEVEINDLGS
jgi:hypothetical protein